MFCSYMLLNVSTLWPHVAVLWRSSAVTFVAFYFFLYAVSAISFGVLLMSLKHYLLVAALALLVVIVTTNHLAREMLDLKVVNEQSAEWLLSETGEAADAVRAFFAPFARNLAFSVASLVPAVCVARLARRRFRAQLRPVPLFLGALLAYGLTGVTVHRYFKPYIPIESNLVLYGAAFVLKPSPDVPPVDMKPVQPPEVAKIILVVDESVTYGAYVTQLRGKWARWNGVDFGEAASLGNCSGSSNSMLRWGFRATRMLAGEDPRLAPTVWSYAHGAGYETFLIDGQRGGSYQNFMRGKEAALIDHRVGVSNGFDTDRRIAELLHTLMLEPGKRFVYINKRGSHFPYTNGYPADRFPNARTREQQHAVAVRYSTQGFLDTALSNVPRGDILILYTSDHGQRFSGGSPHCNPAPTWQESSVPLLMLTGNEPLAQRAAAAATLLKDRASHEQIFATLLAAMGYDLRAAEAEYGSSLLSASVPQRYFHVRANPVPTDRRGITVDEFSHFPHRAR